MIRHLRPAVALLAVAAVLPAAAASAAAPTRVSLTQISGPTPFPAGCPGAAFDDAMVPGFEMETTITANRAHPDNLVAGWIQDVSARSTRTDITATSHNGGRTWTRSTIPGLTKCEGGTADSAADPWLSSGSDGTVYFAGLAPFFFGGDTPFQTVVASHSVDGGRSWAVPTTLAPPANGNETPAITGSPTRPRRAYGVWAEFATADLRFSTTDDRGVTWAPSTVIDQPANAIDLVPRLVALRDGTLVTIFARAEFDTNEGKIYAIRSRDDGRTWTAPVQLAAQPLQTFADDRGVDLPQPQFLNVAVAPDGAIYVTVEADDSSTSGVIAVVASHDGGATWAAVTPPGVGAYAFEPAIAVDPHGTIGVTWYDLRRDRPGDSPLTADVWFASSNDQGASWRETHVAGPTDLRSAGSVNPNYVGEYQGLTASGPHRFVASLTLAAPFATDGPTDVFAARIHDGSRHGGRGAR